jgi:hypothetical protein
MEKGMSASESVMEAPAALRACSSTPPLVTETPAALDASGSSYSKLCTAPNPRCSSVRQRRTRGAGGGEVEEKAGERGNGVGGAVGRVKK